MGISFNVDNSWMSWTLDIVIVSAILVGLGTYDIEKFISSSFYAYVERPSLILYVSYTSI
jgi:hypothetical protein